MFLTCLKHTVIQGPTLLLTDKFFTYRQAEGKSFNNFVTELRTLSAECEFENLRASLIKDMIICGVRR